MKLIENNRLLYLHPHRTMIGSPDLLSDKGVLHLVAKSFGNQEIIDAPSDVSVSALCEVAPPGVFLGLIRVKMPESVYKTAGEEFPETISFFIGKTRTLVIGLRVREVDIFVRYIEITANDDRFLDLQTLEVIEKKTVPKLTVFETLELPFGIGRVDGHEKIFLEFERDNPTFRVVLGHTIAITNRQRRDFREHRRSGITLAFCGIPVFLISESLQIESCRELILSCLDFLKSYNIGGFLFQVREKSLRENRSYTVYIPAYCFHGKKLIKK